MNPGSKVLLLGNSGFVGRNVARVLQGEGVSFVGASRSSGVDLQAPHSLHKLLGQEKPAFLVNCAAHVGSLNYVTQQAAQIISENARMILALYEAVAAESPNTRIINPIANCAYPSTADTFVEDEWWNGHLHRSVLSYGETRRFLWAVAECFQMQHSVRSIHLLVPNMYGPHDSTDPNKAHALNALVSKFVKAKQAKIAQVEIWGTGVAIREWLYAADFGRLILQIIRAPEMVGLAEPVNVGQNFGLSVRELVGLITKETEYAGEIRYDDTKPDGAPRKVMDDRKFRKVFPDFSFTPLDTGLRETVNYYSSIYPYP